jgi:hypothetical protein
VFSASSVATYLSWVSPCLPASILPLFQPESAAPGRLSGVSLIVSQLFVSALRSTRLRILSNLRIFRFFLLTSLCLCGDIPGSVSRHWSGFSGEIAIHPVSAAAPPSHPRNSCDGRQFRPGASLCLSRSSTGDRLTRPRPVNIRAFLYKMSVPGLRQSPQKHFPPCSPQPLCSPILPSYFSVSLCLCGDIPGLVSRHRSGFSGEIAIHPVSAAHCLLTHGIATTAGSSAAPKLTSALHEVVAVIDCQNLLTVAPHLNVGFVPLG